MQCALARALVQTMVLMTALVECSNVAALAGVGLEAESREPTPSPHTESTSPERESPVSNQAAVEVEPRLIS